ncbi:MAG TPA: sugar isomerase, partial [Candidatus Bathyarchaeia archaeon]|nr:sugar isomerase [Candidatus Bathyarchaeia archaeon]
MSTIAAYEKEIMMQLDYLQNFQPQQLLSDIKQKKSVFCGTGDSYASALLTEVFSQFRTRSHDPLDLLKNKNLVKNHDLYLISISGNTLSNINLGKLSNSIAITANKTSRLAQSCKKIILLQFENTGTQTSGSISFLASALTCISLVSRFQILKPSRIFGHAKKTSKEISVRGKVYILGNLHTFPVAYFFASKLYEILGMDAHYERIEQFSHAGLFSTKRGDTVIILEEKNSHNEK